MTVVTLFASAYVVFAVTLFLLLMFTAVGVGAALLVSLGCGSVGAALLLLVWCGYDVVLKAGRSR